MQQLKATEKNSHIQTEVVQFGDCSQTYTLRLKAEFLLERFFQPRTLQVYVVLALRRTQSSVRAMAQTST